MSEKMQSAGEPRSRATSEPGDAEATTSFGAQLKLHVRPLVTIFGAGITGLSAAHELIERGYRVCVVEAEASAERDGECEVGGIARTQMVRVPHHAAELISYLHPAAAGAPPRAAASSREHDLALDFERIPFDFGGVARAGGERAAPSVAGHGAEAPVFDMVPGQKRHCVRTQIDLSAAGAGAATTAAQLARWLDGQARRDELEVVLRAIQAAYRGYRADLDAQIAVLEQRGLLPAGSFAPEGRERDARLVLQVRICAHTDDALSPGESRQIAERAAQALRDRLCVLNSASPPEQRVPLLESILRPCGVGPRSARDGAAAPARFPRAQLWASFEVEESLLPGEHGYRYFPAFYRHITDVMRRTQILDERGRTTSETAFDRLVASPDVALSFAGPLDVDGETDGYQKEFPRRRAATFKELRTVLELTFDDMGVTERDLIHYEMQLLRYATSCTARRREYEAVSWWDFVRGRVSSADAPIVDGDHGDPRNHIYSGAMTRWLREIPQALAAMEAAETDARTYGTITTQLMAGDLGRGEHPDRTLNGPTSAVWLREWKRYLKHQGVQFYTGRIAALRPDPHRDAHGAPRLAPILSDELVREPAEPSDEHWDPWLRPEPPGEPADRLSPQKYIESSNYFVLAVPLEAAAALLDRFARELAPPGAGRADRSGLEGDLGKLWLFAREAGLLGGDPAPRDATGRPIFSFRYPLRDLAGIQYFFPQFVRVGHGHIYYADAEWGLSSVSQVAFWRDRPGASSPFLGQISVDIGDWYAPFLQNGRELVAAQCDRQQIAEIVWQQIQAGLSRTQRRLLTRPTFYHLDFGIQHHGQVRWISNATPFLINLSEQWALRPGLCPIAREALGDGVAGWADLYAQPLWLPRAARRHARGARPTASSEIRYRVAHGQWVLAGTYMATCTRLNTMEAANESARHAVNAILEHRMLDATTPGDGAAAYGDAPRRTAARGHALPVGVAGGDACEIWDPEQHEWDDLEPLKRLDEALHREGLPHFLDILRVPEAAATVPHRKRGAKRPLFGLMRLLDLARETAAQEWSPMLSGLDGMQHAVEERLGQLVRRLDLDR